MLRFKTDHALPASLAARARVTGRFAQVSARDAADVEAVLAQLREAGVPVEDLEIGRADLEDVFLDIMTAEHARNERAASSSPARSRCSARKCCASGRWRSRPSPRRCSPR